MDARVTAVAYRFVAFFLIAFIIQAVPLLQAIAAAGQGNFSWPSMGWALFTALIAGLGAAAEKVLAPVLIGIIDPTGQVIGVKGVPLRMMPKIRLQHPHTVPVVVPASPVPVPAPAPVLDPVQPTAPGSGYPVPPISAAVAALEQQLATAQSERDDLQSRVNAAMRAVSVKVVKR